jgi:hypothetical protein
MTSQARIEANRKNAQKSTGPKTAEGKARSRFNGLTHGLRSEQIVLPTEDRAEFEAELQAWNEDWKPPTAARRILVERAAAAAWRLRRSVRVETERLERIGNEAISAHETAIAARLQDGRNRLKGNPRSALAILDSFYEGVAEQIAMWSYLAGSTASHDFWHNPDDHHAALLNLLGWPRSADHEEVGTAAKVSWRLLVFNSPEVGDDPDGPLSAEGAVKLAAGLHEYINEQIASLRETLTRFSSPESVRFHLAEGAYLDASAEGKCLMRYEAQNDRSLRASIAQLIQLTKTGADLTGWEADAPTEPNDDAKPVAETVSEPEPDAPTRDPEPVAPTEPNPQPLPQLVRDRGNRIWPVSARPDGVPDWSNG